jgi:uncharacterized protein (DUF983 family)
VTDPVQEWRDALAVDCHKCAEGKMVGAFPLASTRMIVCQTCGYKRCPKASDHTLACTGSNEPGQPGSIYTGPSGGSGNG